MTHRLYQGITSVADISASLHNISKSCHPERSTAAQPPRAVEGSPFPGVGIHDADTLHEECGVVAIYGHPDAAREAYLALYALQHRGQESAGIATADGQHLANIKGMGLVSEAGSDKKN